MIMYDPLELRSEYLEWKKKQEEEWKKQQEESNKATLKTKDNYAEWAYINSDHPNTMEDSTAIILYIIIMGVGAIFKDRWLIWIIATVIFVRFINRKNIRQKEWNSKHKKDGNNNE